MNKLVYAAKRKISHFKATVTHVHLDMV